MFLLDRTIDVVLLIRIIYDCLHVDNNFPDKIILEFQIEFQQILPHCWRINLCH